MEFVTFRREVVRRRSEFQLQKAKDRLHILEWLKRAIDIIDDVIYTIRHSKDKKEAKDNLILKFQFSEEQAEYILQMRLQSLVWLEIQKVLDEIAEKQAKIAELTEILANPEKLDGVVQSEFDYMKQKYGDERKTEVSDDTSLLNLSWSIKAIQAAADRIKEDVICRIGPDYSMRVLYQTRIQTIPEETIDLIYTHNQDRIIVITDLGELVVQRLKDFGSQTMAKPAVNLKNHFNLKWKVVFAKTLHSNNIHLAEPETPLVKISDKAIAIAYRPWEEKDENRKYKDEKKKSWPEEQDNLFTIPGVVPSAVVNPEEEKEDDVEENNDAGETYEEDAEA